jgi:hypothetical protein
LFVFPTHSHQFISLNIDLQAGLFTAIVTAFTVESYKWLQPDPMDVNNRLLLALSQQMANASTPAATDPSIGFEPTQAAVRINCFWFLSITVSLTAGVIGILCKQWMREFQRDAALPPEDALALRQLRYGAWERWGVPHIISAPAILLQTSLALFFAGLVDLMWSPIVHRAVAICATMSIGFTALLMALTTVLPAVYYLAPWRVPELDKRNSSNPCPYKSPQSYLLMRVCRPLSTALLLVPFLFRKYVLRNRWTDFSAPDKFQHWLDLERRILSTIIPRCGQSISSSVAVQCRSDALSWVQQTLGYNSVIRDTLFHCLESFKAELSQESPASDCRHKHCSFPATKKECENTRHPELAYIGLAGSSPRFQIELYLRLWANGALNVDAIWRLHNLLSQHSNQGDLPSQTLLTWSVTYALFSSRETGHKCHSSVRASSHFPRFSGGGSSG